MRARTWVGCLSVGLSCLAIAGCSGKDSGSGGSKVAATGASAGTSSSSSGSGGTTGDNGSGNSTSSSGGLSLNLPDSGTGGDTTGVPSGDVCGTMCPTGGTCSPEVCDGVDNNCDGIIDNVDKNGDGICDCLLIATLGLAGTWGQGDVFSTWLSARSNTGAAPTKP